MMEKVAERIERLEKEIGSLNDDIREIEGNVFDVELVLECLPLGKLVRQVNHPEIITTRSPLEKRLCVQRFLTTPR